MVTNITNITENSDFEIIIVIKGERRRFRRKRLSRDKAVRRKRRLNLVAIMPSEDRESSKWRRRRKK
ncbi:hypothetical protein C0583_03555 [Candidatus Parcubacteria bacterium]|nr:MAG: hypothetical protein C0583_03555 [Candidatus Parcubacteria bacterium]